MTSKTTHKYSPEVRDRAHRRHPPAEAEAQYHSAIHNRDMATCSSKPSAVHGTYGVQVGVRF